MARLLNLPSKISSKTEAKSPLGWLNKLLFLTVAVLVVLEALVTNAKASNGGKLGELQHDYEELSAEVTQLELEVASYSSLTYIKHYATTELKMEPTDKNMMYLPFPTEEATSQE